MNPIQLAMLFADDLGLDYYPVGNKSGNVFVAENAIALIGFQNIVEALKAARRIKAKVCLFKNTDTDLLEVSGDLDYVLEFLTDISAYKMNTIHDGALWMVGIKVSGFAELQKEAPC